MSDSIMKQVMNILADRDAQIMRTPVLREEDKHKVTITLLLDEDVTPRHIAERVMEACVHYAALRVGEGLQIDEDGTPYQFWRLR